MLGEEEEQDSFIETADTSAVDTVPFYSGEIMIGGYVFMLVSLLDYSAASCLLF
jgi:hypothetical protein